MNSPTKKKIRDLKQRKISASIEIPTPEEVREGRFDRAVTYLISQLQRSGWRLDSPNETMFTYTSLVTLAANGACLTRSDARAIVTAFKKAGWDAVFKPSSPGGSTYNMITIKEMKK